MTWRDFFKARLFKIVVIGLAGLAVLLLVFKVGMVVGMHKAGFSSRWGENYERNFGGPRHGSFMRGWGDRDMMRAHGVFGQILKIDGIMLVIKDRDNAEKIVLLKDDTTITRFRDTIKSTDLKVDDNIVVIGQPNESGQIEAKFIRVMPPAPAV